MKTLKKINLNRQMRPWQEKAMRRFSAKNRPDFLLVGTPGSGKTFVTLMIAYQQLLDKNIDRIVIVVPTEHLKRQWAEAATLLGIDLDYNWQNASGRESADYFGVVVTYQQVSFAPDLFDMTCRKKTLVIFDEIHHAGDSLDWGIKLRHAFRSAQYRICLSGTPFRSDDNPIPFVEYVNARSKADFTYSYGQALADGVCRPIYFPTIEGNASWIRPNGKTMNCSMLDGLSRQKAGERLRTVVDAGGEWLPEVLREADALLTKMRLDGHSDAAGLVIALNQSHARKIAHLLEVITNETPALAISDEELSSLEIRKFAKKGNHKRWIVAVKMVSEGVDIPRLRVGVYATTILSEMFFRQVVGRLVRMIEGLEEQSAALFLPFDDRLVRHALTIRDERQHILQEIIQTDDKNGQFDSSQITGIAEPDSAGREYGVPNIEAIENENVLNEIFDGVNELNSADPAATNFEGNLPDGSNSTEADNSLPPSGTGNDRKFIIPLASSARMFETVFNGENFTESELNYAEGVSREFGMRVPPAQVAALIKKLRGLQPSVSPSTGQSLENNQSEKRLPDNSSEPTSLLSERKHKLRQQINSLANRLAHLLNKKFEEIHRKWIIEQNGSKNNQATEAELQQKYEWLINEIKQVQERRNGQRQQ